jgi:proline dehydrogenase
MPRSWVWFFSKKYIAGEGLEDAIGLVQSLNDKGIYATIDVLGEAIKNRDEAVYYKNKGLEVLDSIVKNNLKANLSIKPTQMGLGIDEEFALQQVTHLVNRAKEIENFIRIDMEDSPYTDSTIRLYKRLREKYDNVGVVIQSYLKRSYNDVFLLNELNTNYRLCKGIYVEPAEIAYKGKQEIRDNFMKILELMLKNSNYVGIATHDEYLINKSYELINKQQVPKNKFEFQMLLGVREDLRDKINSDGFKIRVYIPFGKDWYAYSVRRLKENPQVTMHIIKNVFGIK